MINLEHKILAVLSTIRKGTISEIYDALGKDCKLNTLAQRLATMAREGKLKREEKGVYEIN